MNKPKTYKDYLKKGNKISPEKLAPLDALPKTSRGDSHRSRRIARSNKNKGVIEIKGANTTKAARKRLES